MNRAHLIERIKYMHGNAFTAEEALEAVLETIVRTVAEGERVMVTGFGSLEPILIPARRARNPQTGEVVEVGAHQRVKFRPGQNFVELVNGNKLLPEKGSAIKKAPKGSVKK
jgi:DNA-binding protein HU-beta